MAYRLERYKVGNLQPTAYYIPEFITKDEEKAILSSIYSVPKPKWTQLSNRRLQNWGGIPHIKGMVAESMPAWLEVYLNRVNALAVIGHMPNHVLVNEYLPGQGIMPHLDGSLFYPTITTISVGSHTVLRFTEAPDSGDVNNLDKSCGALLLEPRSLLILSDSLYTNYLHYIEEVKQDILDDSISNLDLCSNQYVKSSTIDRDTRISLTIRHVPKTTSFKLNIGNKR